MIWGEESDKVDYCSYFPEYWLCWVGLFRWEVKYIGDDCKVHDDTCSFHKFLKRLWERKVVGSVFIALGGGIGCWAKYTHKMWKRI